MKTKLKLVLLEAFVLVGNWLLVWFVIPNIVHKPEHRVICGYVSTVGKAHEAPEGNVKPNVFASELVGI